MTDRTLVVLAVGAVLAALVAPAVPVAAALLVLALAVFLRRPMLVAVALALVVGGRSHAEAAALASPVPERVEGVAELVSDPVRARHHVRVVLRVEGRRYVASVPIARASPLRGLLTGERVHVTGRTAPLDRAPPGWVRSRHLAARLSVIDLAAAPGSRPWYRVANAVHRTLHAGASPFADDRRPLYLGLVIGDDRDQSELTEFRFREAGLTHLLAVSGSNVAFVLAVAGPVLTRMPPGGRAAGAVAVLGVFLLVTRADPSVLRATTMAAIAVVATLSGRLVPATRILSLAVVGLLVVDPLLVHSLGFQLSVAATAGLLWMARPLLEHLPGPLWLRAPVAVTLAAQAATAPLLVAMNGAVPSVATLANLLAGPAAGLVMMSGVTLGAVAGLVREPLAGLLQLPARVLVAWIDLVAIHTTRLPLAPWTPARLVLLVGAGVLGWGIARADRFGRRRAGATALVLTAFVVASWPTGPGPGEHELSAAATVRIGPCGGAVVLLAGPGGSTAVLEGLSGLGVRRLDLVVVTDRRSLSILADLRAQFGTFEVRSTDPRAGLAELGPGRRIDVGGVGVLSVTSGPAAEPRVEWAESPCVA